MGNTGSVTKIPTAAHFPDGQPIDLYYWHSFGGLVITDLALTTVWMLAHGAEQETEQAVRAALREQGAGAEAPIGLVPVGNRVSVTHNQNETRPPRNPRGAGF